MRITRQFGRAVKARRLELNMTQEELAERAHLTPKYITRIEGEAKDVNPTLLTVKAVADALNVQPSELLKDVRTQPVHKRASAKRPHQELGERVKKLHPEAAALLVPVIDLLLHRPRKERKEGRSPKA